MPEDKEVPLQVRARSLAHNEPTVVIDIERLTEKVYQLLRADMRLDMTRKAEGKRRGSRYVN